MNTDRKLSTREPREGSFDSTKDEETTAGSKRERSIQLHLEQYMRQQQQRNTSYFVSQGAATTEDLYTGLLPSNETTAPNIPSDVVVDESTTRLLRLAQRMDIREAEIQRQTAYVKTLCRERDLRQAARRELEVARCDAVRREAANLADLRARHMAYLPDRLLPTELHSPIHSSWIPPQHSSSAELVRPTWGQDDRYPTSTAGAVQRMTKARSASFKGSTSPVTSDYAAAAATAANTHTQVTKTCRPANGKGVSLALESDSSILSDFQILLRKSLEFFEVQEIDMVKGISGRKKELEVGQVGIRCIYCAHRPPHWRGRGAVYYPRSLGTVYQAAQNMGMHHFMQSCTEMPQSVKDSFDEARQKQKKEIRRSGGKTYWTETSRHMGLEEREGRDGMWFKDHPSSSTQC